MAALPFAVPQICENDETINSICRIFVFFAKAIVQFVKK